MSEYGISESAALYTTYNQAIERVREEHDVTLGKLVVDHRAAVNGWLEGQPDDVAFQQILTNTRWTLDGYFPQFREKLDGVLKTSEEIGWTLPTVILPLLGTFRRLTQDGHNLKLSERAHIEDLPTYMQVCFEASLDGSRARKIEQTAAEQSPRSAAVERLVGALSTPTVVTVVQRGLDQHLWLELVDRSAKVEVDGSAIRRNLEDASAPLVTDAFHAAFDDIIWKQVRTATATRGIDGAGIRHMLRSASDPAVTMAMIRLLTQPDHLSLMYSLHGGLRPSAPEPSFEIFAAKVLDYFDPNKNPEWLMPFHDEMRAHHRNHPFDPNPEPPLDGPDGLLDF